MEFVKKCVVRKKMNAQYTKKEIKHKEALACRYGEGSNILGLDHTFTRTN